EARVQDVVDRGVPVAGALDREVDQAVSVVLALVADRGVLRGVGLVGRLEVGEVSLDLGQAVRPVVQLEERVDAVSHVAYLWKRRAARRSGRLSCLSAG